MTKTYEEWDSIFKKENDTINDSINIYLELKSLFQKGDSRLFRYVFMAFYGMKGKLNKDKRERFFSFFWSKDENPITVRKIVNEIKNDNESSTYFSFVTKMLNMRNENLYPIYDYRIANNAFGCNLKKGEMNLDSKEECYNRIKILYDSIEDSDPAIESFKSNFPQTSSLGKMRILDFILYNILK